MKPSRNQQFFVKLGNILRNARLVSALSQDAMGEAIGCTFQQVQKYEKGLNRIPLDKIIIWARMAHMDMYDLLEALVNEEGNVRASRTDLRLARGIVQVPYNMKNALLVLVNEIINYLEEDTNVKEQ